MLIISREGQPRAIAPTPVSVIPEHLPITFENKLASFSEGLTSILGFDLLDLKHEVDG